MTLYDKKRKKIIDDFQDKAYRDAFVEEHIYTGIPFQIKALRDQKERNWTQKDLGIRAEMAQGRISLLESPDYERLNLKTLLRLASAFDIALMVRFVPFSELVKWELNLNADSLNAVSYADDPFFNEIEAPRTTTDSTQYPVELSTAETSAQVYYIKDRQPQQKVHLPITSGADSVAFNL